MSEQKKKPFKDTKLGEFLRTKVPGVLDIVDDYFPPAKILTALVGKASLPPEDQAEFDKLLKEHEKEMFELQVKDREGARAREIEYITKLGHVDFFMYFLGACAIGIFSFIVWHLLKENIPDANSELVYHTLGILEGVIISIYSYYWGASIKASKQAKT